MTSPYHAHFDLRDEMRRLVFWLGLTGTMLVVCSILFPTPFWSRAQMLLIGPACLGLAWGIHSAREWARIAGAILFGIAAVLLLARLDSRSVGALLPVALCVGLARPSTKRKFADAREMIRRTAEIRRDKALARKQARERIAARRRQGSQWNG